MSDTRGTQTDLVTDRNIADCLMELKSNAEFQDLSYRLSRSCTGEMTMVVTRDSLMGLLGEPFDPISLTVTASGSCYRNVLFTPVKVINLKDKANKDLSLRKFRNELWHLNGHSGYGFCPGFKETDFPEDFPFEGQGLEILRHPFTRVQAPACEVFVSQRRSNSRVGSQPLTVKLCFSCLETVTNIFFRFKALGRDLSVPAFAKVLPFDVPTQTVKGSTPKGKAESVSVNSGQEESVASQGMDGSPGLQADLQENSVEAKSDMNTTKVDSALRVVMRGCHVLLDRVPPGAVTKGLADGTDNSSDLPTSSAVVMESLPASTSAGGTSLVSAPTTTSPSISRMQTSAENGGCRPVLSARIKPFRAEQSHQEGGKESGEGEEWDLTGTSETDKQEAAAPSHDLPPSPDGSPGPLLIDEGAELDPLDTDSAEPEVKRPCLRCEACQETFPSVSLLEQHGCQHQEMDSTPTPTIAVNADSERTEGENGVGGKSCPICHCNFSNKAELESHLIGRHGARFHPCRYCGQKFALKKNLADHLQRHRGQGSLKCQECGLKFTKKKHFAAHVREHMGSLPYFCTICSRLFSREYAYTEHMKRHRARRGVRAVLGGSEKTLQGIMSKAKKCLEEKALMASPTLLAPDLTESSEASSADHTPASSPALAVSACVSPRPAALSSPALTDPPLIFPAVNCVPSPPTGTSSAPLVSTSSSVPSSLSMSSSAPSVSVPPLHSTSTVSTSLPVSSSVSDPISSNLLLLSAVSLGEFEGQAGQRKVPPSSGDPESASLQSGQVAQDSGHRRSPQSDMLLQQLNGPIKLMSSAPRPPHTPPTQSMSTELLSGEEDCRVNHDSEVSGKLHSASLTSPGLTGPAGVKQEDGVGSPGSSQQDRHLKPDSCTDRELTENQDVNRQKAESVSQQLNNHLKAREEKVNKKEEELKELERTITKKNMMFFQQLLLAHMNQQSKGGNSAAPAQGKGDKPTPQQALAMFTALNNMATRGVGRGAGQLRPLAPKPVGVSSESLSTAQPSVSQTVSHHTRSSLQVPSVTSASGNAPHPGPVTQPSPFRQPPPPVCGTTMSTGSSSSISVPSKPPGLAQTPFFLRELMSLESKMPASAKAYMPPSLSAHKPSSSSAASPHTTFTPTPSSPTTATQARGGGAEERRRESGDQGVGGKKRGAWSGGLVKEKLNSVITMVPAQEMQRLLALTQPPTSLTTRPSPRPSPSLSASSLGSSPSALSRGLSSLPPSSQTSNISNLKSVVPPSPKSALRFPPQPAQSAKSPQNKKGPPALLLPAQPTAPQPKPQPAQKPQPTPKPQPSLPSQLATSSDSERDTGSDPELPPMPELIPASAVQLTLPSRRSRLLDHPPLSAKAALEDAGPMDLTKASSDKAAGQRTRGGATKGLMSVGAGLVSTQPQQTAMNLASCADTRRPSGLTLMAAAADGGGVEVRRGEGGREGARNPGTETSREASPVKPLDPKLLTSNGVALLQHFLPVLAAQRASLKGLPPFPSPSQARMMAAVSGPGLGPMVRGRVTALAADPPRLPSQSSIRGNHPHSSTTIPSAMPSSASRVESTVTSSYPVTSSNPASSVAVREGLSVRDARPLSSTSRLSPSSNTSPLQQPSSKKDKVAPSSTQDQPQQLVNPLGGFAWHRPIAGPHLRPPHTNSEPSGDMHSTGSHEGEAVQGEEGGEGGKDSEKASTADENMWQQQFLATLREKRRQKQEQQSRQQQPDANPPSHRRQDGTLGSPTTGQKPATRDRTLGGDRHDCDAQAAPSSGQLSTHPLSPSAQPRQDIHPSNHPDHVFPSSEQVHYVSKTTGGGNRSRGRGRGRPRGRGRKRNSAAVAGVQDRADFDQGVDLCGLGVENVISVEPLENGVRCDDCGHVFYNETDVLQHDCEGEPTV